MVIPRRSATSRSFPDISPGRGVAFQLVIDQTNLTYRKLGLACITRKSIPGKYITCADERSPALFRTGEAANGTPSPLSSLRTGDVLPAGVFRRFAGEVKGRRRLFIPESRAEPDYGGVVAPQGRGIVYDAKSTRRERLDFDNLHPHQIAFLENMAECGAIAGFLVEFVRHNRVFFVPVQMVQLAVRAGISRNIPYSVCATALVSVSPGRGGIVWDYLAAIARQEQQYGVDYAGLPTDLFSSGGVGRRRGGKRA